MSTLPASHPHPMPEQKAEQEAAHALPIGTRLLDYEIAATLGAGATGIVYLAADRVSRQRVAIKEYLPPASGWRSTTSQLVVPRAREHAEGFRLGLRSFMYEARLLVRLDHPALIKVLRFWELNGTAYMAMPFQEHPALASVLDALQRPANEHELRAWLAPLLDALAVLHAVGCAHRGVTADNILVTPQGPLLLDLGPVSPQQTPSNDLYALAVIAYRAITGQAPADLPARLAGEDLAPLSVLAAEHYSAPFLQAIDRALALWPDDRPQTVTEFKALLAQTDAPVALPAPAPAPAGGDDWSDRVREFLGEAGETPVQDGWWEPAPEPESTAWPAGETAAPMPSAAPIDVAPVPEPVAEPVTAPLPPAQPAQPPRSTPLAPAASHAAPPVLQAPAAAVAPSAAAASRRPARSRHKPAFAAMALALLAGVAAVGYRLAGDGSTTAPVLTEAQPAPSATAEAPPAPRPAAAPSVATVEAPAPEPTAPEPIEPVPSPLAAGDAPAVAAASVSASVAPIDAQPTVAATAETALAAPSPSVAVLPPAVIDPAPAAEVAATDNSAPADVPVAAVAPVPPAAAVRAVPPAPARKLPRTVASASPARRAAPPAVPPSRGTTVAAAPTRTPTQKLDRSRCNDMVRRASIEPVSSGQAFRLKEECQK